MADKAIGSLVEATVINDADRFVLEQSGQAKQISGATMISELAEALDGHGGIQSIVLVGGEGNVKTYRITFTDGTTYDYEVRDGESGNYAVVARNLAPYSDASGATQSIPFLSQGTGRGNGSATVPAGNYCQLKKLGNTVCVNQLWGSENKTITANGITITYDKSTNELTAVVGDSPTGYAQLQISTAPASIIPGRTYIIASDKAIASGMQFYASGMTGLTGNVPAKNQFVIEAGVNSNSTLWFYVAQTTTPGTYKYKLQWRDLDIWYGSHDRIPSDLFSHPENWGRYYAGSLDYNAGTLESADGSILTSIHRNIWDEETELGTFDWNTGVLVPNTSRYRSKNFCRCIPNETYYLYAPNGIELMFYDASFNFVRHIFKGAGQTFIVPSNASYFKLNNTSAPTYGNDITISLYYPGESGYDQYYPFSGLAEVDTGSEVLRSAGSVADEKLPSGDKTQNIKVAKLSELTNWARELVHDNVYRFNALLPADYVKPQTVSQRYDLRSNRYITSSAPIVNADEDKCMSGFTNVRNLYLTDHQYTSVADLLASFTDDDVVYYHATSTTEQGTAFPENIPCDPVGSMSWENTNGIPQGAEIFYPFDYAGTLDSMLKALPSANGTYTFKATVSSGKITYSWVAD